MKTVVAPEAPRSTNFRAASKEREKVFTQSESYTVGQNKCILFVSLLSPLFTAIMAAVKVLIAVVTEGNIMASVVQLKGTYNKVLVTYTSNYV